MTGEQLLKARVSRNWEQQETADKLKVSQPYLSLIEAGKRPIPEKIARRAVRLFKLPPTALPVKNFIKAPCSKTEELLASQLAALGYPGFSHLKKTEKVNPAVVLISTLQKDDIDSRIVEALPWLIYNFSEMNWMHIINSAKLDDAQNRLGFLISLALDLALNSNDETRTRLFKELLLNLERSKLVYEDSFRRSSLTEPEKKWLKKNRPRPARHWRVLSNLSADHLVY